MAELHHRDKLVNVLLGEWVVRLVPGIHIADRVKIDDGIPFRLAVRRAARSNAGSQGVPLLPDGGGPIGGPVAALPGEQCVQRIRAGKAVGAGHVTQQFGGAVLPAGSLQFGREKSLLRLGVWLPRHIVQVHDQDDILRCMFPQHGFQCNFGHIPALGVGRHQRHGFAGGGGQFFLRQSAGGQRRANDGDIDGIFAVIVAPHGKTGTVIRRHKAAQKQIDKQKADKKSGNFDDMFLQADAPKN